jgi:hypothetical protein
MTEFNEYVPLYKHRKHYSGFVFAQHSDRCKNSKN